MGRNRKHVWVFIKGSFSSIPMMDIPINYRHTLNTQICNRMFYCDNDIRAEHTKADTHISVGMMTWRTRKEVEHMRYQCLLPELPW